MNGKDWTPSAFLSSQQDGGLGLDLARDRATQEALGAQLAQVLRAPVDSLRSKRLEAADFHGLAAGDPVGLLLEWMGAGASRPEIGGETPPPHWAAFKALCKPSFGFDPDKDGVITAVDRLVTGGGIWDQVWKRYRDSHKAYAGVRRALDLAQPKDLLDDANDRMPMTNRKQEDGLRSALAGLLGQPKGEALKRLGQLCAQHVPRAQSLWADLGEAPLARGAVHLKTLADGIAKGGLGNDWTSLAAGYVERGWLVDAAAWRLDDELRAVALRVRDLLQAGWQRAVLITDHGWLLLPGALPKVDLPGHLAQSRRPRCAVPQPGAHHGFKELPWFWGGGHSVVFAPGISAFKAGVEYAHGGLSPQEALTPTLTVTTGKQAAQSVEIVGADWKGMRLRVQLKGGYAGTGLDIRTKPADAGSSVLDERRRGLPPGEDGSASLLVTDDEYEGAAAVLVASCSSARCPGLRRLDRCGKLPSPTR